MLMQNAFMLWSSSATISPLKVAKVSKDSPPDVHLPVGRWHIGCQSFSEAAADPTSCQPVPPHCHSNDPNILPSFHHPSIVGTNQISPQKMQPQMCHVAVESRFTPRLLILCGIHHAICVTSYYYFKLLVIVATFVVSAMISHPPNMPPVLWKCLLQKQI
jgi:hypothetical protein